MLYQAGLAVTVM